MTHRTRITAALLGLLGSAAPVFAFGGKHHVGTAVVAAPVATVATVQTTTVTAAPAALVAVPATHSLVQGGGLFHHRSVSTALVPVAAGGTVVSPVNIGGTVVPTGGSQIGHLVNLPLATGAVVNVAATSQIGQLVNLPSAATHLLVIPAAPPVDPPVADANAAAMKQALAASTQAITLATSTHAASHVAVVGRLSSMETTLGEMERRLNTAIAARPLAASVATPDSMNILTAAMAQLTTAQAQLTKSQADAAKSQADTNKTLADILNRMQPPVGTGVAPKQAGTVVAPAAGSASDKK